MEDWRGQPSRARLAAGVVIATSAMVGGYLFGLLVIGDGRREVSSLLWGVLGSFVGLFAGVTVARALLFRRWHRR